MFTMGAGVMTPTTGKSEDTKFLKKSENLLCKLVIILRLPENHVSTAVESESASCQA